MSLISNVENDTTTSCYTITKVATLSTLKIVENIENDKNDGYKSIKLSLTTLDGKFTSCLVDYIQSPIRSY